MTIRSWLGVAGLCMALAGCGQPTAAPSAAARDQLTQVSLINALMLGQYDGVMTLRELLQYGDFGLGTCDHLHGELIVLDGTAYRADSDGKVVQLDLQTTTPFAVVTPFEAEETLPCPSVASLVELETRLDQALPQQDLFIAFRIEAEVDSLTLRSVPRQEPPYKPLVEVTKLQTVWTHEATKGVFVGLRCPAWVTGLNVPGYHWHFLSDDRTVGGHVLDCRIKSGLIAADPCEEWLIKLADSGGKDLSQDLSEELEQVEKLRGGEDAEPAKQ